jgi:hypothetical protein
MLDLQPSMIYLLATLGNIFTVVGQGVTASLRARRDRRWAQEDLARHSNEVIRKIEENTDISRTAFDAANHVNEKIATVTATAAETASAVAEKVAQTASETAIGSNEAVLKELKRITTYTGETRKYTSETRKLLIDHIEDCQQLVK